MTTKGIFVTALCASLSLVACTKDQPTPEAAKPSEKAVDKPAEKAAEAGHRKMANCPSSVEGATTKVEDAPDSVIVTITGAGEPAIKEIRERAKHLAEVSVKVATEIKHSGEGEGGGGLGQCPVVLADTTITSEEVEGGAKVTVKPAKAEDLPKLAALAKERHSKLAPAK
jgi:hypothetical protein